MIRPYALLLIVKLLAVLAYAGGACASLLAEDEPRRKRFAHRIASPSLVLVWSAGFVLVALSGWRWNELWIVASLLLSFASNAALSWGAARAQHRRGASLVTLATLALVVALMVLKPTWRQVLR